MRTAVHFRCRACGSLFLRDAAVITDTGQVRCPDCPALDLTVIAMPASVPPLAAGVDRKAVPPVEMPRAGAARLLGSLGDC